MKKEPIHLLVTLNENYLDPLKILVTSINENNYDESFELWLMHSTIPVEKLEDLSHFLTKINWTLHTLKMDKEKLHMLPDTKQYPNEMYFRLLAPKLFPDTIKRVLYLDPDILVINSLRPLWKLDMKEKAFALASHTGLTDITNDINNLRLGTTHAYYNTGVMLIDIDRTKNLVINHELYQYVDKNNHLLILPDQDVFNALYGKDTMEIPDEIWNYDARKFSKYLTRSLGEYDIDWVITHTVILHFCGKSKPWRDKYTNRFRTLYKHYQNKMNHLNQLDP